MSDPKRTSASSKRFHAKLGAKKHPLFFEVPFDVKKEFGKARQPVKVFLNGYSYRSTVSVYGGKYYVPVNQDRRRETGLKAGDIMKVILMPDNKIRTVKPPQELLAAFKKNGVARERWGKLSYSHKKEYADFILQAKKAETRARRVAKTLVMIGAKTR